MIKEIKRLDLQGEYISAGQIGAIVKYYTKQKFKIYNDVDFIASRIKWTKEERNKYEKAEDELDPFRQIRFKKGFEFEKQCKDAIKNKYVFEGVEFFNWNEKGTVLFDDELKMVAIPDYIVKDEFDGNKIIECKGSLSSTPNLKNYKYQLALQYYLLKGDCECVLMFKEKEVVISSEEIEKLVNEIIESIKQFWIDFKDNKFKTLSVDKMIEKLKKEKIKNSHFETNNDILQKIHTIREYEMQDTYINQLKDELFELYKDYDVVSDGESKISIVKPTKTLITKEYYKELEKKAKDKYEKDLQECIKNYAEHKEDFEKISRKGYIKFN